MKNIVIKRLNGEIRSQARFEDDAYQSWIDQQISKNSWGKPERWIHEMYLESLNENINDSIDTREIEDFPAIEEVLDENNEIIQPYIPARTHIEYKFPCQYTIEVTDCTEEVQKERLVQEGIKRQNLGAQIIAKVFSINESKELTIEQFNAIMSDSTLERIERLLWTGSLRTAKLLIQSLDTIYYTTDEKNQILEMLTDY